MIMRVLLFAVLPCLVTAADTCFTSGELAGVIFISIFGAFIICVGAGLIIWFLIQRFEKAEKRLVFEKAHATQLTDSSASSVDLEERGMITDDSKRKPSVRDQEVEAALPTPLPRRKIIAATETSPRTGRSRSLDNLQSDEEKRRLTQLLALRRFGFTIDGNEEDGIFVDRVLPGTPAEESGNIFAGDKIKTLMISFENMSFDDALAVLALVTDYTIRLDLERVTQLDEMTQTDGGIVTGLMRLPGPLKSMSSPHVRRRLQNCSNRHCESAETLGAPALPPQQPAEPKNMPLPSCKWNMEEERVIKIVRHARKPQKSVDDSDLSEGSSFEATQSGAPPPGHMLIRASDFDRRMKTLIETETAAMKQRPASIAESSDSGESSAGSTTEEYSESVHFDVNKAIVTASETTVDVNSNTRVLRESAAILQPTVSASTTIELALSEETVSPPPPPSPQPDQESVSIQVDEFPSSSEIATIGTTTAPESPATSIASLTPSPIVSPGPSAAPMDSLSVDINPSETLAVTSPHSGGLTPDFIEVRAQKFSKAESDDGIVDRKLPSLPEAAIKAPQKAKPADAGQMYLQVRSKLKEVYTSPVTESAEETKPTLSETQFNTLESNRRKLEREQQQLKELGIL